MNDRDPFAKVYQGLCTDLLTQDEVRVRGINTREIVGATFRCDPDFPFADRPQFSKEFALTETLQVITGRGDLGQLKKIAPRFASMAPSYVTYGPRIAWQLKQVVTKLQADPNSRQSLCQVHTPDDLFKSYPETPCTLSLQFLARRGQLHQIVSMRSNDIWYGTPTDVWMFSFFQRHLAKALALDLGIYQHSAGSLHVYEDHYDSIRKVGNKMRMGPQVMQMTWDGLVECAHMWLDYRRGDSISPGSMQGQAWDAYLSC